MLGIATLTTVTSSMAMTKPMARVTKGTHPAAASGGAPGEAMGRQADDMVDSF